MSRTAMNPAKAALTKTLRREAGRWLKSAREAAGLTQAELAEATGLRYYTFVSQVENGLGRVPIETQAIWAQSLGLDPSQFARTLLRYYEPELHRLLFEGVADDLIGDVDADEDGDVAERAAQG